MYGRSAEYYDTVEIGLVCDIALGGDCSPVFVKKTYHSCALLVFIVLLANLARLCDLPRVILSADRIYPPKAGTLHCLPLLDQPLAAECIHCSLQVIIRVLP